MAKCSECASGWKHIPVEDNPGQFEYVRCTKGVIPYEIKSGQEIDCGFFDDGKQNDPVNNPSHYDGEIQCIDYIRDKLLQIETTGFCTGNVIKYVSRWRKKDGIQDLKKAKVYLDWAIKAAEKELAIAAETAANQ